MQRNFILTDVMKTGNHSKLEGFINFHSLKGQAFDLAGEYYTLYNFDLDSYDRKFAIIDIREAAKQLQDPNGPRVAVFELDGFDTHAAQGGVDGAHADELEEVNNIVKILYKNLGPSFDNTIIVTLTEFS